MNVKERMNELVWGEVWLFGAMGIAWRHEKIDCRVRRRRSSEIFFHGDCEKNARLTLELVSIRTNALKTEL